MARVVHLDCGALRPPVRWLVNRDGSPLAAGRIVCHCLLVETSAGPVLVDAGLGVEDFTAPRRRLGLFSMLLRPPPDPERAAVRQLARLGVRAEEVRHIVMTHLDVDHAGGLADFPRAQVHLFEPEWQAALGGQYVARHGRYRSAMLHGDRAWVRHELARDEWYGFAAIRVLPGVTPELLLVPLVGHTPGHSAVAVQTEGGWLFHAGDAYHWHGEIARSDGPPPVGMRLFTRLAAEDRAARVRNARRVRDLRKRHPEVRVFSSHDPLEFDRLVGAAPGATRTAGAGG